MLRRLGPRRGESYPVLKGSYGAVFRGEVFGTQPGRRILGCASHKTPQFTTIHQDFPGVTKSLRNVETCGQTRAESTVPNEAFIDFP